MHLAIVCNENACPQVSSIHACFLLPIKSAANIMSGMSAFKDAACTLPLVEVSSTHASSQVCMRLQPFLVKMRFLGMTLALVIDEEIVMIFALAMRAGRGGETGFKK